MDPSPGALLISDGGVASLLAAAALADGRMLGAKRGAVWIWVPRLETSGFPQRLAAAAAQAQVYGLREVTASRSDNSDSPVGLSTEQAATRAVLDGCFLAQQLRIGTVVWPASAGPEQDGGPDLDLAASIVDRALLASRLASVDGQHPVEIRAPYADLTDEQLADLILDMDLPIWSCWWNQGGGSDPAAAAEREHWARLLRKAGWSGELPSEPPAPPIVTRPDSTSSSATSPRGSS